MNSPSSSHHHHHQATHPHPQPHLLSDLRLALSVIYSLPSSHPTTASTTRPTAAQAHEYLLQFQSRNPRRKLHSNKQQQQQPVNNNNNNNNNSNVVDNSDVIGSTWLACLHLIASLLFGNNNNNSNNVQQVHYAEALFAAQTLVHRLRRLKLAEAIDMEFEEPSTTTNNNNNNNNNNSTATPPPAPEQILQVYRAWVDSIGRQYNGGGGNTSSSLSAFHNLTHLLYNYHPVLGDNNQNNPIDMEERIKGEISLMVLATILDTLVAKTHQNQQQQNNSSIHANNNNNNIIRPLLTTLASSMVVITARMRYTPSSYPAPTSHTQPMVHMIVSAISMIQQNQQQQQQQFQQQQQQVIYICLTALPDAVLRQNGSAGSGGGAYGRFSLDPRCYASVTKELKTEGLMHICQALPTLFTKMESPSTSASLLVLQMLEAWAKVVPIPMDFLNASIPLVLQAWNNQQHSQNNNNTSSLSEGAKAAMGYWIAVMEGGSWTVDQVLAASLLPSKEASQQPNKKRQSSKSRKREKQVLEERTTVDSRQVATMEVQHRGLVACAMAQATWSEFQDLFQAELDRVAASSNSDADTDAGGDDMSNDDCVEGGGPVGAVAACAAACLPHILRTTFLHGAGCADVANLAALFLAVSQGIQKLCESPSRIVRSFAAESLYALHEEMMSILVDTSSSFSSSVTQINEELLEGIIHHFYQSSLSLASKCGYPSGYFADLTRNNNEDLECERNDVRDVLRTVAGIPSSTLSSGTDDASNCTVVVCSSILLRLVQACADPIQAAASAGVLFPETALHAFSALAKPINTAAILHTKSTVHGKGAENIRSILNLAFGVTSTAGRCLNLSFPTAPTEDMLPLSRLYNLAIASLTPMLSSLVTIPAEEAKVMELMTIAIVAAATSLLKLPELMGPSSLRSSRFDIRGAMRSPGGEDHVGVLTLMRLANESNSLSLAFVRSKASIVVDLCSVYEDLKNMEVHRGAGIFYGIGVLPKSRRILLGIICHLEIISAGAAQASGVLESIFNNAVTSIVNISAQFEHTPSAIHLHDMCESTFDIAAFSPQISKSIFTVTDTSSIPARCLHTLHEAGNFGFRALDSDSISPESIIQWNRLRAALFTLLRTAAEPDLPVASMEILSSWIKTECEAVIFQCLKGPTSSSRIFHEEIISEEVIPPGLFLQVLVETLERAFSSRTPLALVRNTLACLYASRQAVFQAITSLCSSPVQKGSFHDPRPVLAETWFHCMNQLSTAVCSEGGLDSKGEDVVSVVKQLILETFVAAISLLLYCSLEKKQDKRSKSSSGMTLDGPQGLVMAVFFEKFFLMGPLMLKAAMEEIVKVIPVEAGNDSEAGGLAIIGAALFRGSAGGLPPWAVESTPSIYSAFFYALNKDVDAFGFMLTVSMHVRLLEDQSFGCLEAGDVLSGKLFGKMSDKAKSDFVNQAKELARLDTAAAWKRLKFLIKQVSGGKKKDTDFNQRPALTRWGSLDRI